MQETTRTFQKPVVLNKKPSSTPLATPKKKTLGNARANRRLQYTNQVDETNGIESMSNINKTINPSDDFNKTGRPSASQHEMPVNKSMAQVGHFAAT